MTGHLETIIIQPRLEDFLPMTLKNANRLSRPLPICLLVPLLAYHLWVYIYLGHQAGGTYFYTGCMYAFNYAGTCVAYWIICRQCSSCYISDMSNIIWHNREWDSSVGCHEQLLNYNLGLLSKYSKQNSKFTRYCSCWECLSKVTFFIWWGAALVNIVLNILQDMGIFFYYESFDDKPLGLYGYYNLFGQIIAGLSIVTAAVMMLTGFKQLECLITGFAYSLRDYQLPNETETEDVNLTRRLREQYLSIQASCIAYSELWSTPIVVALTFCSQVVISSIFVIHYSVEACVNGDECGLEIIFPFVWLLVALVIMGIILNSIAKVNGVTQLVTEAFTYAGEWDYQRIDGRQAWLDYLSGNPLSLTVCGMVITTKLVVNTGYTVGVAVGSFLASNVFG